MQPIPDTAQLLNPTISVEHICGKDLDIGFIRDNPFSWQYLNEPDTIYKINDYAAAMLQSHGLKDPSLNWLPLRLFFDQYPAPINMAAMPMVYLSSGYLYEGKHRMAALYQASQTDRDVAYDFVVIRGWDERLPMPTGWEDNYKIVDTVWWRYKESLYNAMMSLIYNDWQPTELRIKNGIVVQA